MPNDTSLAKIMGISDEPCIRTDRKDKVFIVQIGKHKYPLHIEELWKKLNDQTSDSNGTGSATSGKSESRVQSGKAGKNPVD